MGNEHAPVPQAQVTKAPPAPEADHDESEHEGPTNAVFNSWKQATPPTPVALKGKQVDGSHETIQAVNASFDAIAGMLDAATERIDAIIKAPMGPRGPGIHVDAIEREIDHAYHAQTRAADAVARYKPDTSLGTKGLSRITTAEARLEAAIQRATAFAKANGQTLDARPLDGIHASVDGLLAVHQQKRASLDKEPALPTSAQDLRARAVTEHLEAAVSRAQFIRMGIDAATHDAVHTAIEEYTAHLNTAKSTADALLDERAADKKGHRTPAKLSSAVKKLLKSTMSGLAKEVGALLAENKGNPKIKEQTKWSDVIAKLNITKEAVDRL